MLTISVKTNIDQLVRQLDRVQREQVPFALAHALTMTAQRVKDEEVREMRDVFDRPTPYTLKSLFTKPATKSNLTAYVWLKDDSGGSGAPATEYLAPQIFGGVRSFKRFEAALRSVGALPAGYYAVPGTAAKLDAYGNMNRGQIVQILSYFQTFRTAGYTANITKERKKRLARGTKSKLGYAYFVGRPGDGRLPLGIWQRFHFARGSAIKPVLIFVNGARYRKLFDFYYVAGHTIGRDFPQQFRASLQLALSTARPASGATP